MSSSPKSENVEDSPSDGAFEELHKHINDVHDILKRETNSTASLNYLVSCKRKMSSFHKSQYLEDSLSDGSFEELYKHIGDVYDILKRETKKLRKEKEAFDEVAKKLDHVHFSKMLKLNVGGHMFTTSLETMTKDPGNATVT